MGKSSLVYKVAEELGLGRVRHWPINSRSTLRDGLYQYDAMGRMHHLSGGGSPGVAATAAPFTGRDGDDIERFITLRARGRRRSPSGARWPS